MSNCDPSTLFYAIAGAWIFGVFCGASLFGAWAAQEPSKPIFRRLRRFLRRWWKCRTKRCDYYDHYLAYGPAELTHEGFHAAERLAEKHFRGCAYNGPNLCPICEQWEERVRA